MFNVEFTRSVKGKHPIARFRLNREECNTYCYVGCGRKDNNITYYGCNQCKGVDRNAKGCKQIHLNGTVIVNGDPSIGHKEGCKALRTAVVHAEDYKRRASKEVRVGTTTIGNARLHNHSLMLATCDEADVDETETRKSWVLKSLNSRLNKNKVMRVASITETGDLPQELKETFTGRQFLRFESDDRQVRVFADEQGLCLLRKSPMWKADGTFKSAPKGHTQLYTIHARHTRGETIPALYAVMVRKTKSNYRKLFRWLNAELEDEDGSIGALQTVLIDFEPAAKGAFDIEFFSSARNIAVKGCRFHYGQAVSRNFDKKGLKPLKDNDEVFKWRKEILGLALLPPKYVRFIWNTSLRYPPKIRGFSKQFQNFVKYFENQWLSSEEHILHWNHFDNSLCRTTNSAEGWHAGLKATWSGMKPILTTFIEWLKKKNEEHVTRMVQLDDDSFAIKRRDAAYIRLDAQILAAKQRFTALESIENQHYEPDMIPIILRHLRHVSSLCGNVRSKKNAIAPVPIDPSSISLLDPIEPLTTIDLAIASVIRAATNRCRAVVHTYLPPCTCQRSITQQMPPDDDLLDISDDLALEQEETEDSEAAEPESVESLLEFGPCKECQENTADLCSACKLHMHFECGAYRDESIISLCDDCCNEIADVNHIYGRMARRKELEARLQRVYDENFVSDPNCLFYH